MGTRLPGTYMDNAKLNGAELNATDLTEASLREADFTGAKYLGHREAAGPDFTGANLDRAIMPVNARLPDGWARNPKSGRLMEVSGERLDAT
jgi:uncharacterized protein YjbI with pentapeptide repeats